MLLSEKLSVGVVVSTDDHARRLIELQSLVDDLADDNELIVVVNGVSQDSVREIVALANDLSDTTVLFLEPRVDYDAAQLIVLDNAIGDWILLAELDDLNEDNWKAMLAAAAEGHEMVVASYDHAEESRSYSLLRGTFLRFVKLLSGLPVAINLSHTKLFSRVAALHILRRKDALVLLRCNEVGASFPSTQVSFSEQPIVVKERSARQILANAIRMLNVASSAPVRGVVVLALLGAVLNLAYSGWVITYYLLSPEVAPGWATLSLQISGMFFLFSLVFLLIGEYLVSIDRATNQRIKYNVVREIRSMRTRANKLTNVIEHRAGTFVHQESVRTREEEAG